MGELVRRYYARPFLTRFWLAVAVLAVLAAGILGAARAW